MENNKTPSIRFKGFTDPWEQRKLGDVIDFLDTLRKPLKETDREPGPYPYYGASGIVDHVADYIFDEELILLSEDGANITDRNYPVCFLATGKYWVNNHAHVLKARNKMDNNFICMSMERKDYSNYNTGMAMPKLNKDTCCQIPVDCPTFEEQKKIGDYFRNLDNLITLHQRKYNKLLNVKKSMLEKMFPKNGSNIPEIRFKGFTDPWEQRKLGDQMYIKSRIGWQALTKKEYLETGDYYLITGTDIDEDKHIVDFNCCYYVSKERYEMDDKIQVYEGDIIVTKDGTIGKVAMVTGLDKPATLNSHLFVLRDLSGKLYNRFLLQVLVSHIFGDFVESTKTGSTLTGLPQKTFVEFRFLMPEMVEQMKIAQYLDNLDNLITLHQRELEKLQYIKKSMLEKMFV